MPAPAYVPPAPTLCLAQEGRKSFADYPFDDVEEKKKLRSLEPLLRDKSRPIHDNISKSTTQLVSDREGPSTMIPHSINYSVIN
jgi:hypothetical protein